MQVVPRARKRVNGSKRGNIGKHIKCHRREKFVSTTSTKKIYQLSKARENMQAVPRTGSKQREAREYTSAVSSMGKYVRRDKHRKFVSGAKGGKRVCHS